MGAPSSKGNLCPDFRQIPGGQRTLPAFVGSQLPFAETNPEAKVAYFGVAYTDPLQEVNISNLKFILASVSQDWLHRHACRHTRPQAWFNDWLSVCGCLPIKLYLWTWKFQFHIPCMWYEIEFFWFFQPFQKCWVILSWWPHSNRWWAEFGLRARVCRPLI